MYRFFYNFKTTGDVLFLLIHPEETPNRVEEHGKVVALYKDDVLVGVNFFAISKTIKIHNEGMIPVVGAPMLECFNLLLANAGLPTLEPLQHSGYVVLEVKALEEHPLDEKALIVTLSDGEKDYSTVSRDLTLKVGERVVAVKDGTILYDGSLFSAHVEKNIPIDVALCNASELRLGDAIGVFRAEEATGSDFYLGGK